MATTREITDAEGTWHEELDDAGVVVVRTLLIESAATTTDREAKRIANIADLAKISNNAARIRTLGISAAKFAKDPVANAANALNNRQQHELFARLAIATLADDQ